MLILLLDAYVISEDNMNKNNIQLKWKLGKKALCKAVVIERVCNPGYTTKTSRQSFLAIC